jgi:hypothetical protein
MARPIFIERGRGEERSPGRGRGGRRFFKAINGDSFFPWHQWREREQWGRERNPTAVSITGRGDGATRFGRGALAATRSGKGEGRGRRGRVGPAWQGEKGRGRDP